MPSASACWAAIATTTPSFSSVTASISTAGLPSRSTSFDCGQPPFFSDDPYADIHRQMHDAPPPIGDRRDPLLAEPSAELQAVLLRCLERDPSLRYGSATEVMQALEGTPEFSRWQPESSSPRPEGPATVPDDDEPSTRDADERAPTLMAQRVR